MMVRNFKKQIFTVTLIILSQISISTSMHAQNIITPESFFGFQPGADHELFNYRQLIEYLQVLDENADEIELRQIGESPMGKPMYLAFISSPENIAHLDELAKVNTQLALNPDLSKDGQDILIDKGKVFFLATLSMHSSEVGPSQSAPLIAYDLITTSDPEKLEWMKNVVYMMVPCHNPDGMDMIVKHYQKYKGTKYDGSNMPGVYHKYVGHDNNRDFITLTQSDTKAISDITSHEWFPQVMVEKHQMGRTGVRYFVPPNHDPIAENIDAGIWNWNGLFGTNMIKDLTAEGCSGVAQRYAFDNYWPGSTETCLWKNVMAFLTEAASCNSAKPVYIEPNELNVWGKGLSEYKKSSNMPDPWPGGWWRLSDIVKYEIVSTESIIETCSENKADILKFRNDICRKAVEKGKTEMPFYYILPSEQNDHSEWIDLARLLTEHGVDVYKLTENTTLEGKNYSTGAFVVPLSQPFRPFIKEVLEIQEYPVRHYTPNGDIIKPYDITSWSLPLHKGVACYEINTLQPEIEKKLATWNLDQERSLDIPENTSAVVLNASDNSSYLAAFKAIRDGLKVFRFKRENKTTNPTISDGSFIISIANSSDAKKTNDILGVISANPVFLQNTDGFEKEEIKMPRIALVESWFHDMDAGWTRFVLDSYAIEYQVLHPEDFKKVDLDKNFDVMIFPSENKDILLSGKYKSRDGLYTPSSSPPEYAQSIGEKGFDKVLKFIDGGGKVVSWGVSTALFIGPLKIKINDEKSDEFILPVRDQSKELLGKGLYCPGSLVNIRLKKDHPITLGMESDIAVFYRGKPVFTTREPYFDMDRRVIATFPDKDILKSGYIEKEELLAGKSALVWIKKGKGQIVLFAFSPQFRASTPVSYKLLFNAILLPDFNQK